MRGVCLHANDAYLGDGRAQIAERYVLVHLDELVLIRLPALLRDLAHALAHARKRPAPAHGHHQEDPLAQIGDAQLERACELRQHRKLYALRDE